MLRRKAPQYRARSTIPLWLYRFGFSPLLFPSVEGNRDLTPPLRCPETLAVRSRPMAGDSSPSPASASVQVLCAGCRGVLAVGPGVTEFICPKCRMEQRLPPQLMPKSTSSSSPAPKSPAKPSPPPPTQPRRGAPPAQGVDPTKIQLPCAGCQAVLNVPHGLARFRCPQCGVDLAVDHTKLQNFLASSNSAAPSGPAPTSVATTQPPLATSLPVLPSGMAQPLRLVAGATISMMLPAAEPPEEINEVRLSVPCVIVWTVNTKGERWGWVALYSLYDNTLH